MNAAEAKVPNNGSDWQSIDIFLFSNGQQYSPPRKYHLRSEELNWWDATLNHLARSHYGLMHPLIYLYTTDGRKIEGPLELRDGSAYVAVEPPDPFIDAGYEKYLIRASRSWEKRQAKKANLEEVTPAQKHGCNHDQPCCLCPEKERYAPKYVQPVCWHTTSALVSDHQRTGQDEQWKYYLCEKISPSARKRLADCPGCAGVINTVLARAGESYPWTAVYDPITGEYIVKPGEYGAKLGNNGTNIDDYGTKLDEHIQGRTPGENGRAQDEYGRTPDEYGRTPDEYGRTPGDYGRIPDEHGRLPDEFGRMTGGPTPSENKRTPGENGRTPVEYARLPDEYGRLPDEHGRTTGENGRTPGEYGLIPNEYGRIPNEYGRIPAEYGRVSDENGRITRGNGRTPGENGRTPGVNGSTLGENGRTPGENGRTPGVNGSTPGENGRTPGENGRTPGENRHTPGENGRTVGEHGRTTGENEHTVDENGYTPGVHGRAMGENGLKTGEYVRTLGENDRTTGEHGRTMSANAHPTGEYDRIIDGLGHMTGENGRNRGEHGRAPGDHGRSSGERERTPGENGRTTPGEIGRSMGKNGRTTGAPGSVPGEHGRISGEHRRTTDESGHTPGENGRTPGEHGRTSGEHGRTTGHHGRTPGENGRTPGESGHTPGENGRTPGENGRTPGEYGRTPGEYGRTSGENGGTTNERGRTPGDNGAGLGNIATKINDYGTRYNDEPRHENSVTREKDIRKSRPDESTGKFGEPKSKTGEQGRLGEHESRLDERESRVGGPGMTGEISRVGEHGGKVGEHRGRATDRGARSGDRGGRVGGEHSNRTPGHGGRTGEVGRGTDYGHRPGEQGRGNEYVGKPGEPAVRRTDVIGKPAQLAVRGSEYVGKPDDIGARAANLEYITDEHEPQGNNVGGPPEHDVRGGERVTRPGDNAPLSLNGGGGGAATGYSYITETQQHIRRSSITTAKTGPPTENKKRWSSGQHTTFKKPSPNLLSPAPLRRSEEKKPLKNSREDSKKSVAKSPARTTNSPAAGSAAGKPKAIPKYSYKRITPPAAPPPSANFEQTVINTKSTSLTKITSTQKCLATDSAAMEDVIDDKEIIVVSTNIFRNQESEITSFRLDSAGNPVVGGTRDSSDETQTEQRSSPQSTTWNPVNEEVQTCKKPTRDGNRRGCGECSTRHTNRTNSKIKMSRTPSGQRLNMVSGDSTPDDNYIAIINKGDVVNLKLNIEVRNGERPGNSCDKPPRKSRSLTNITRAEIGSQISIDDDLVVQSKSLQSLLNIECIRGTGFEGCPKVVVVQCACCGQRSNNPASDSNPLDTKKYFVLMPSSQQINAGDKCDCKAEQPIKQIYEPKNQPQVKKTSISLPIKKTCSSTSLEAVTVRETGFPFPSRDVGMYMATTNSICQTEVPRADCSAVKHRVSITQDQTNRCDSVKRSTSQISVTQTDCVVTRNSYSRAYQNSTDSQTQTEWCNLLLEARRHEDGRYSFHLPPLHVLRYYTFS